MPYMDGMEMISRLQEMYPTMKYIVLSGYDDFIYVKQALQRQVLDYLLKPLSAQGIMKVLRRAKEQLDEQDRQRVNLEILRDKVAKNAQQLRRGVVLEYLSGSFGGDAHALCAYPQPVDERIAFPMYLGRALPGAHGGKPGGPAARLRQPAHAPGRLGGGGPLRGVPSGGRASSSSTAASFCCSCPPRRRRPSPPATTPSSPCATTCT